MNEDLQLEPMSDAEDQEEERMVEDVDGAWKGTLSTQKLEELMSTAA